MGMEVTEWLGNIWEDMADMADILPQIPGLVNVYKKLLKPWPSRNSG
jgi:hypothetical protein